MLMMNRPRLGLIEPRVRIHWWLGHGSLNMEVIMKRLLGHGHGPSYSGVWEKSSNVGFSGHFLARGKPTSIRPASFGLIDLFQRVKFAFPLFLR